MPATKRTATGVLGGLLGLVGLSTAAAVLVTATITPAIAVTGYAASSAITMFDNLPEVLDIEKPMLPSRLLYTDPATGTAQTLATFYDQDRSPVTFDQVATVMYDAILSSEDPRYYQHGGIDMIGTARALIKNTQGGGQTQGGSSISQQYVKNILVQRCEWNAVKTDTKTLEEVLAACWFDAVTAEGTEGYQRKLQEMRYAIALEQKYSKNEILLGYLNIANFGGQIYGVNAAARYYFNTDASHLTLGQAAALAGMVKDPNVYRIDQPVGTFNGGPDGVVDAEGETVEALDIMLADGKITQEQYLAAADGYTATKGRQLYVLSQMRKDGKITQEQYEAAAIEPLTPSIHRTPSGCGVDNPGMGYFCKYVKDIIESDPAFGATPFEAHQRLQRGGLDIYTTLDPRVQAAAEAAMTANVPSSVSYMELGATIASIEADTGRVLAIAQNTVFTEDGALEDTPGYSSLVYAGDMEHGRSGGFEAGSTFKLFTLIDWLEKGHSVKETVNGRVRAITKMKDSCAADGYWFDPGAEAIKNFGKTPGRVGNPLQFTASSLNSGYLGMAEKLDLCDIQKVATRMGVTLALTGEPVEMNGAFSIIGPNAVSPIAMAAAYATVANNGTLCQPRAIDRIVDSDGNDLPLPARTCSQVIDPKVAATAAFALQGVMVGGGTGSRGNPYDGTPLIGKTGTHEAWQTWLIESSTQVATVAWVGNSNGRSDVFRPFGNARYGMVRETQRVADSLYPGAPFPQPDANLTRTVLTDLPNVVGKTMAEAKKTLEEAGFEVIEGAEVDSSEPKGIVATQDPAAGRVSGGTAVTISPSNGQASEVPSVGGKLEDAVDDLRSAGFMNVEIGSCTPDKKGDNKREVVGTSPAAGTVVNRTDTIKVNYTSKQCP